MRTQQDDPHPHRLGMPEKPHPAPYDAHLRDEEYRRKVDGRRARGGGDLGARVAQRVRSLREERGWSVAELARRCGVHLLLGLLERDGDAVHNSAVLIGPDGTIVGKYRKVHLAVGGEMETGILPGDDFPVFDTAIGRVGCNICMDSSAAESSRMIGLHGADFLLLPLMGDHRAWHPENHVWDPERFKGIMMTRAVDNQLCMVVAVNRARGSCIIDRTGHVLAWNDGDRPYVSATVVLNDGFRPANKGCYRSTNWMQRRPHAYSAFVDSDNLGGLLPREY